MKLLLLAARSEKESVSEMLEKAGISLTGEFQKKEFMTNIIKTLEVDQRTGEIIFQQIASQGVVSTEKFIEFIESFDKSEAAVKKEPETKKIPEVKKQSEAKKPIAEVKKEIKVEATEKFDAKGCATAFESSKNYPFFNLLDAVYFNEEGTLE